MKERFYKITTEDKISCYVEVNDIGTIESFLDGLNVGLEITVEVVEMSRKKYEKLPEYEG